VAEATEEAVYNSLLMARSVTTKNVLTGETKTIYELPVAKVREIFKKYGRL
jgi:D-aminopeptidase